MIYQKTRPCANCPYRCDAPLAHWDRGHFVDLLDNDKSTLGSNYGCHKNDGHVCRGFLMNQDERGFPSIALRISLSKNEVSRDYLDKLNCSSEMFETVEEMAEANFPGITE